MASPVFMGLRRFPSLSTSERSGEKKDIYILQSKTVSGIIFFLKSHHRMSFETAYFYGMGKMK